MNIWKTPIDGGEVGLLAGIHDPSASRRAVNMLPDRPLLGAKCKVIETTFARCNQLLITLEGNQQTGVLKVINPRTSSRAGVLIFRGRVVGAVYGRKNLRQQVMDADALRCIRTELATSGNFVDSYDVSEPIVLAATSLFYGNVLQFVENGNAVAKCDWALSEIIESGQPGCMVINSLQFKSRSMVYVYDGELAGIRCADSGWLAPNIRSVHKIIQNTIGDLEVSASILHSEAITDYSGRMGFSLSGLLENKKDSAEMQSPARRRNDY